MPETKTTDVTIHIPPGTAWIKIGGLFLKQAITITYPFVDVTNHGAVRTKPKTAKKPTTPAKSNARSIAQRKRWAEQKRQQREAAKAAKK